MAKRAESHEDCVVSCIPSAAQKEKTIQICGKNTKNHE
jgi:hypothetical protein